MKRQREDNKNGLPTLRYTEHPGGIITVYLPNNLVFHVDVVQPDADRHLVSVINETNPLQQFVTARRIGFKNLSKSLGGYISHAQLHFLATGVVGLTEESRKILKDQLGIDFDPAEFRQRQTKGMFIS